MKVNIQYPTVKCAYCGKEFERKHNRQKYCSPECSRKADYDKARTRSYQYYHRHKNRINHTKIGTRTIGPHKHENTEREAEIIQNEIERIGLRLTF